MTAKPADIGSKRLISLAPDAWVQWLLDDPAVQVEEMLSADFQWVGRESDVLLQAQSAAHGEFLVLNEIQLHYRSDLPIRMRAYAALAEAIVGIFRQFRTRYPIDPNDHEVGYDYLT